MARMLSETLGVYMLSSMSAKLFLAYLLVLKRQVLCLILLVQECLSFCSRLCFVGCKVSSILSVTNL